MRVLRVQCEGRHLRCARENPVESDGHKTSAAARFSECLSVGVSVLLLQLLLVCVNKVHFRPCELAVHVCRAQTHTQTHCAVQPTEALCCARFTSFPLKLLRQVEKNKKRTHETRHKIDGSNLQLKCDKATDANADGDA